MISMTGLEPCMAIQIPLLPILTGCENECASVIRLIQSNFDLTLHTFLSGNKVRKLEYSLAAALEADADARHATTRTN